MYIFCDKSLGLNQATFITQNNLALSSTIKASVVHLLEKELRTFHSLSPIVHTSSCHDTISALIVTTSQKKHVTYISLAHYIISSYIYEIFVMKPSLWNQNYNWKLMCNVWKLIKPCWLNTSIKYLIYDWTALRVCREYKEQNKILSQQRGKVNLP